MYHGAMRRQIPSLSALETFEAVARHGSATQAAEELGRTQSAVSRQISNLEAFARRPLFKRTHGRHASVIAGDPNGILFGKPVDKNANEIGDWRGSPDHITSHIILRRRVPKK